MTVRPAKEEQNVKVSNNSKTERSICFKSNNCANPFFNDIGTGYTSYSNRSSINSDNPFHKLQQQIGNQALLRLVRSG